MAKILVAEDDQALCTVLKNTIRQENHEVDVAHDGEYALELIQNYKYDLLLLDWDLPKISGLEVCQQYRKQGGRIPILFLTGKSDVDSRVKGLDTGADDYLCKPFVNSELLARLRALLRRDAPSKDNVLKVGNLTLDQNQRQVTNSGIVVELSRKELAILEFFMRHPNQVFDINALVERIWSSLTEIDPETVRPYIKHLRDKLADQQGNCPIVTVRGSGYMLKHEVEKG